MINAYFWIAAIILFLIIEGFTATLVSIWFSIGAFAALVAEAIGVGVTGQILTFIVFSAISIAGLRKIALRKSKENKSKINLDRIVGQRIIVTETVDKAEGTGVAKINDVDWRIVSEDGEVIEKGETVTVKDIDGVKLVVKKVEEPKVAERQV